MVEPKISAFICIQLGFGLLKGVRISNYGLYWAGLDLRSKALIWPMLFAHSNQ
jgi:hypothetical protein